MSSTLTRSQDRFKLSTPTSRAPVSCGEITVTASGDDTGDDTGDEPTTTDGDTQALLLAGGGFVGLLLLLIVL